MMSTLPPAQPTRRRLIKGAAWAAPTAAVSVAAPSYAASMDCGEPRINIGYNFTYDYGVANQAPTTQTFKFSDLQFQVLNLPRGVTVTKIDWGMWVDIRLRSGNGTPWQNRGIPYPGAKVRNDNSSTAAYSIAQPVCYQGNTCGWGPFSWRGATLTNGEVTGGTSKRHRDGSTRPSWQLTTTWTKTDNNYTATNGSGCGMVLTGKMGTTSDATKERTQVPGTARDSSWLFYQVSETGPTTATTNYQTYHGAIAYLSNGKTVSTSNGPTDATPWSIA